MITQSRVREEIRRYGSSNQWPSGDEKIYIRGNVARVLVPGLSQSEMFFVFDGEGSYRVTNPEEMEPADCKDAKWLRSNVFEQK